MRGVWAVSHQIEPMHIQPAFTCWKAMFISDHHTLHLRWDIATTTQNIRLLDHLCSNPVCGHPCCSHDILAVLAPHMSNIARVANQTHHSFCTLWSCFYFAH